MSKINEYGYEVSIVRLNYTKNVMVAITDTFGLRYKYFSKNEYKTLNNAKKKALKYMKLNFNKI